MRIADRLALHGAQAEPLRGVVGRLLQPPVVEHQRLGLAVFEEQFAVVGAFEAARQELGHAAAVEFGAVEEGGHGIGHRMLFRHEGQSRNIGNATADPRGVPMVPARPVRYALPARPTGPSSGRDA